MNKAYNDYQALVDAQSVKPTKQRVVQIRKSLIVLKHECDNMRKELLNKPKVEVTPEVTPEVVPEVANEVKSPDPKLTEDDVSWQAGPLPLSREVAVSVSSTEPIKSVEVKKEKKSRKTKKSKQM